MAHGIGRLSCSLVLKILGQADLPRFIRRNSGAKMFRSIWQKRYPRRHNERRDDAGKLGAAVPVAETVGDPAGLKRHGRREALQYGKNCLYRIFSIFVQRARWSKAAYNREVSHILEALYFFLFTSPWKCDLIGKGDEDEQKPSLDRKSAAQEYSYLWKAFSSLDIGPIREFRKRVLRQRVIQFLIKLPLRLLSVLSKLPVLRLFKEPLTSLFRSNEAEKEGEGSSSVETPPTRDELAVPCVADLYAAGVKFLPTDGDLTTIHFHQASATLYLPKMRLDSNTEVIIRNLVAFEALVVPSDLSFIRYADFMNDIIDTDEDVRVLRERGIIYNHLENDGKVASLWNGMGKCVKLSKNKCSDKVIEDMNRYYKRTWSVAVVEYMKKYIFGSWSCLSLLAAIILLLLTCLEAFCSIYNCKRWMKDTNLFQE
ncbi:hypothetical protein SUGI_0720340 [Cryptomeria japonica]|nr:hypothetical protein SUGI_0720340 [Cryptomeria japonica]